MKIENSSRETIIRIIIIRHLAPYSNIISYQFVIKLIQCNNRGLLNYINMIYIFRYLHVGTI